MVNSEQNQAKTTIEMFRTAHTLCMLGVMAIKGSFGKEVQSFAEKHFSTEDIEAFSDFYCSPNWQIIP